MKHTVQGFQQDVLVEYKLDCNDALILRWILDFYHTNSMRKMEYEGRSYFWIFYQKVVDELPILNLKKRAVAKHIDRFVDCGLFSKFVDSHGGNVTYFTINSDEYKRLVFQRDDTEQQPLQSEEQRVCSDHDTGVCPDENTPSVPSTPNIDSSPIDSSIKNSSIIDEREGETPPPKRKFVPPTQEQVQQYMFEYSVPNHIEESHKYMNTFQSCGWVVGKTCKPMKDWKASIRTWKSNIDKWNNSNNTTASTQDYNWIKKYEEPMLSQLNDVMHSTYLAENRIPGEAECLQLLSLQKS